MLSGGVDFEATVDEGRQGVVRLHRVGIEHREAHRALDDECRAGESGLDVAPADAHLVQHVARPRRFGVAGRPGHHREGLVTDRAVVLLVDEGSPRGEGLVGRHYRWEVLVSDGDKAGGVVGDGGGVGDDDCHRLAVVPNLVLGEDAVIGQDVAEAGDDALQLRDGDDPGDTRTGGGGGGRDAEDAGVGALGAHDAGVQHAGPLEVDAVASGASDLLHEVAPADGTADLGGDVVSDRPQPGVEVVGHANSLVTDSTASMIGA